MAGSSSRADGWWRELVDHFPAHVTTVNRAGEITFINRGVTGMPLEDTIGRPVDAYVPNEYRETVRRSIESVFETGRPADYQTQAPGLGGGLAWYSTRVAPIVQDGAVVEVVLVSTDITETRRTEEELRRSEMRYQDLFEDAPDMYFTVSSDGTILNVNRFGATSLGYEKAELMGASVWIIVHPDDTERIKAQVAEIFAQKQVRGELEFRKVGKDGTVLWVRERGRLVVGDDGGAELRIVCRDITARRLVERALADSEERHRLTLDAVSGGGRDWNIETGEVLYSNRWIEGLGYARMEVRPHISFWEDLIHPEDRPRVKQALESHFAGETPFYECENRLRTRSGEYRWHLDRGKVVARDDTGAPLRMVGTDTDITERKLAEQRITTSLREKELLLREVHHRVKNNLQVISSLLSLHIRHVSEPGTRSAFLQAQNRVRAIALVHEALHQTDDLAEIDAKKYIERLIAHVRTAYLDADRIVVSTRIDPVSISFDRCMASGLILNELVSNAIQHAFPDGREGTVIVELRSYHGAGFQLVVSDDGVGMPEGVDHARPDSLGLELVNMFIEQLEARMVVSSEQGTRVEIVFGEGTE